MKAFHIADTGLFVTIGKRYQVVRRFVRQNDVTFVLPELVYERSTVDSPKAEDVAVDTAIEEVWVTVAEFR